MKFDSLEPRDQCVFLALAHTDLEDAYRAFEMIDSYGLPQTRETLLAHLIAESCVVRYARPFSATQITSAIRTTLPDRFLEGVTGDLRAAHERILLIRNRVVAHSDADLNEITQYLIKNPWQTETIWGGNRGQYAVEVADVAPISDLVRLIVPRVFAEQQQLGKKVGDFHQPNKIQLG